jgi:predicted MFS family arabinose efflux permease
MSTVPGRTKRWSALEDSSSMTTSNVTHRYQPDWPVDVLGMLTIAVYGSWYYGFGVLIDDIGQGLDVGSAPLGVAFGLAQILLGALSLITGRMLDRFGPQVLLGVVGPIGAILVGFSGRAVEAWQFVVLFGVGGGVSAAAGFYGMTQAMLVRMDPAASTQRIIRLTIWGAFASPIAIPATELLRRTFGWRVAIEVPAGVALCVFLVSARVIRRVPRQGEMQRSSTWMQAIRSAAQMRAVRWHTVGVFCAYVAMSTLLVFQLSIMQWAGLSAAAAAGFGGARGVLQLLGRLPLQRALHRYGHWVLLAGARLCVAAACGLVLVSGNAVTAILYVVVAGVGIGAISALDGIVARVVIPTGDFGALSGVVTFIAALGGGVAPVVAGRLTDTTGAPTLAATVAAFSAIAAALAVVQTKRHAVSAGKPPAQEVRTA